MTIPLQLAGNRVEQLRATPLAPYAGSYEAGADRSYTSPLQREPTLRPGRIRTTSQDKKTCLGTRKFPAYPVGPQGGRAGKAAQVLAALMTAPTHESAHQTLF